MLNNKQLKTELKSFHDWPNVVVVDPDGKQFGISHVEPDDGFGRVLLFGTNYDPNAPGQKLKRSK